MTTPVRLVLAALHDAQEPVYGLALSRSLGVGTSTLYPLLRRLEMAGWLDAQPEAGAHPGRPARRLYTLAPAAPHPTTEEPTWHR